MESILQGIAAADGYAKGKLFYFKPQTGVCVEQIVFRDTETELNAFRSGKKRYLEHLHYLITTAKANNDHTTADILDAYSEILTDEEIEKEIISAIEKESTAATAAIDKVFRSAESEMLQLEDDYARQRSEDIRQIGQTLIRAAAGYELDTQKQFPNEDFILCGHEFTPADTAPIPKDQLLGIIMETGGKTSHVALLAQNLGIPAVVGLHKELSAFDQEFVLLDGCEGSITVQPAQQSVDHFSDKQASYQILLTQQESLRELPAETKTGLTVQLHANIGSLDDLDSVQKFGAEGIGLFRSEFLFAQSSAMPDEETQFAYYRQLVSAMRGKPVTIRTLDIGGDKPLAYLPLPKEQNPFLGWRACRIYSAFPDLILTQLRAVLRASVFGNVRIMVPMISSLEEVQQMLHWATEAKTQLSERGMAFADHVPLGIMIEIPAAVMMIEELLKPIDFCSIGTNDLTQYTLAVDRGNEHTASLYEPFHPAVLRLIAQTVKTARRMNKSVSLCGELAGDPIAAPLLLGMGLTQFSMSPSRLPAVKQRIREEARQDLASFADKCIALPTALAVKTACAKA